MSVVATCDGAGQLGYSSSELGAVEVRIADQIRHLGEHGRHGRTDLFGSGFVVSALDTDGSFS
jgi:hypothetical protein